MKIAFYKYTANGNDFILCDDFKQRYDVDSKSLWSSLCHRRFGIGADGVLFISQAKSEKCHYKMTYLNADGTEVDMCGNGARALAHYAFSLPQFQDKRTLHFETLNAVYEVEKSEAGEIFLRMDEFYDFDRYDISDYARALEAKSYLFANTGVPHCVFEVSVECLVLNELMDKAQEIRWDKRFPNGCNVNFFAKCNDGRLKVRTYERGVEAETYACGTGVMAIARHLSRSSNVSEWRFISLGGEMKVIKKEESFYFTGDVKKVFKGVVE